jgi:hypothetical protein
MTWEFDHDENRLDKWDALLPMMHSIVRAYCQWGIVIGISGGLMQ